MPFGDPDPAKVRAWQQRSRDKAIEKARQAPHKAPQGRREAPVGTNPHPKPSKAKRAALGAMRRARPVVARRSGGRCEIRIPNVCLGPGQSMHHRQGEGQGGESEPWNLIHTCGDGTRGCHGWVGSHRSEAYRRGWLVRMGLDPREVPWGPA